MKPARAEPGDCPQPASSRPDPSSDRSSTCSRIEALAALRAAHGTRLRAIVGTGSTMTGREAEAEREDFHPMIKPVVPARQRAMIGFKLGMRSG